LNTPSMSQYAREVGDEILQECSTPLRRYETHILLSPIVRAHGIQDGMSLRIRQLLNETLLGISQALLMVNSFQECLHHLRQYRDPCAKLLNEDIFGHHIETIQKLAEKALRKERMYLHSKGHSEAEIDENIKFGTIRVRPFPWLQCAQYQRQVSTIQSLQASLSRESEGCCNIMPSSLANDQEMLGMFANRRLSSGSVFLVEETAFSATDEPRGTCNCFWAPVLQATAAELECWRKIYCNPRSTQTVENCHHATGLPSCTGKNDEFDGHLRTLTRDLQPQDQTQQRLRYRVLQYVTQESCHPLCSDSIQGLAFSSSESQHFSMKHDILIPLQMLNHLGVNIFEEQDLDIWVLQVIFAKMNINCWDGTEDEREIHGVSQLYSFLNHSCSPNVTSLKDGSQLTMKTIRDVEPGEELYVSYISDNALKMTVEKREEELKTWFPRCLCERCEEEREEIGIRMAHRKARQMARRMFVECSEDSE
jgi:hypothetical protein